MRSVFIVATLAAASFALVSCRSKPEPAKEDTSRVAVTQNWTVVVPRAFKQADNGSSWQGYDDHRVVFLASQTAAPPNPSLPASSADDITPSKAWLGGDAPGEKIENRGRDARGSAIIRPKDNGIELKGYMTKNGNVVVCTITADDAGLKAWATDTWRSLLPAESATPAPSK
jgi:hypothetical protein